MLSRRFRGLLLGLVGCVWVLTGMPAHAVHHHHHPRLHIGARVHDISWQRVTGEIGGLRVTRLFYRQLPKTFSRQGVPKGVLLIVSYKKPNTNVASYVRGVPTGNQVQSVIRREPEADYSRGSTFVSQFNAQRRLAKRARPHLRFAFIGGGFAYRAKQSGYRRCVHPTARRPVLPRLLPARRQLVAHPTGRKGPNRAALHPVVARIGHRFNGFTEYGRGAVDRQHPLTQAMVTQRERVFAADNRYLRSLPGVRVWAYWYTTDLGSSRQWRLTDARSQQAWRAVSGR